MRLSKHSYIGPIPQSLSLSAWSPYFCPIKNLPSRLKSSRSSVTPSRNIFLIPCCWRHLMQVSSKLTMVASCLGANKRLVTGLWERHYDRGSKIEILTQKVSTWARRISQSNQLPLKRQALCASINETVRMDLKWIQRHWRNWASNLSQRWKRKRTTDADTSDPSYITSNPASPREIWSNWTATRGSIGDCCRDYGVIFDAQDNIFDIWSIHKRRVLIEPSHFRLPHRSLFYHCKDFDHICLCT